MRESTTTLCWLGQSVGGVVARCDAARMSQHKAFSHFSQLQDERSIEGSRGPVLAARYRR